ncbi:LysR family transcriptional regulator [Rhizobium sp. Root73]|uniref:LysR family transcriptional regulator n=1 Tax=unclassified Rhizobium TaxID=2613769 RepID=UPI00072A18AD|nr:MULTISPECIES: LysR family transcriptional regulator [unclassified Rhizobium]KQY00482.1 LysR family transcriptional regulator [Rhizobium sp. Root1334]KRC11666.1 LysR family transcriptional regulator [Rhizobium sp. Root73]
MLTDLNLNLLRSFFMIAEERSLTRAAARLNMSQPSVSQALQRLEEYLACQLVLRGSRKFELTARGQKVYEECGEIFRAVERIGHLTQEKTVEEFGEVRIQIISNLESPLVNEALRLYHQRYPSVTWIMEVQNSQDTIKRIQMEKCGIGLCLLARPVFSLRCELLFREEFSVYCGAEHPFFGRKEVEKRELRQESFVSFTCATGGMGLEPMSVLSQSLGLGERISGQSPNLEEVRRMIVAGLGIGILPLTAVHDEVANGLLWPLEIKGYPLGADVFLVTHPDCAYSRAEQHFIDLVQELRALYPDMH